MKKFKRRVLITHEMVIQNQDTSEGCKLEHVTETAEVMLVMLMEIFLLLIITFSIHLNPSVNLRVDKID